MEGIAPLGQTDPQKKLPLKKPALLGLIEIYPDDVYWCYAA